MICIKRNGWGSNILKYIKNTILFITLLYIYYIYIQYVRIFHYLYTSSAKAIIDEYKDCSYFTVFVNDDWVFIVITQSAYDTMLLKFLYRYWFAFVFCLCFVYYVCFVKPRKF